MSGEIKWEFSITLVETNKLAFWMSTSIFAWKLGELNKKYESDCLLFNLKTKTKKLMLQFANTLN